MNDLQLPYANGESSTALSILEPFPVLIGPGWTKTTGKLCFSTRVDSKWTVICMQCLSSWTDNHLPTGARFAIVLLASEERTQQCTCETRYLSQYPVQQMQSGRTIILVFSLLQQAPHCMPGLVISHVIRWGTCPSCGECLHDLCCIH